MAQPTTYFNFSISQPKQRVSVLATVDQLERGAPYTDWACYSVADDTWYAFEPLEGFRATSHDYGEDGQAWVTGDRGQVWAFKGDAIRKWQLPDSGLKGRRLGPPSQIRMIGGRPFVCGFAGQFYTLKSDNWVHMDDGLAEKEGTAKSIHLTSLDGRAPDDIYTVGSHGLVAHWDGKKWKRIPALTNVYLEDVRCFRKDWIVVVGDRGVILESDGKKWRADHIPGAEEQTLASVEYYRERLYVAAEDDLYVRNKDWSMVKHGLPRAKTSFLELKVSFGKLWALGFKRLNSFDGKKWKAHPDPDNE